MVGVVDIVTSRIVGVGLSVSLHDTRLYILLIEQKLLLDVLLLPIILIGLCSHCA